MGYLKSINIKFPIIDDAYTNRLFELSEITKDAVSSDLLLLLLTQKGERYYMPDYGTNLIKFIFNQNDDITLSEIETEIKETVRRYLPYVNIDNIVPYQGTDEYGNIMSDNQINLKITFTYTEGAYSSTGVLDLTF